MKFPLLLVFFTVFLYSQCANAQMTVKQRMETTVIEEIAIKNGSFEGIPQLDAPPPGWFACGEASTPDILPGFWEVNKKPADGQSYMGLITREDGTWETASQVLPAAMRKMECYNFHISLALAENYAGYDKPVVFRLWAGHSLCEKKQLLLQSDPITNHNWKDYTFYFMPNDNYTSISIEPFYRDGMSFPYKGNIIFDKMSNLMVCLRVSLPDNENHN